MSDGETVVDLSDDDEAPSSDVLYASVGRVGFGGGRFPNDGRTLKFVLFHASTSDRAAQLMRALEGARIADPERHATMWSWIGGSMSDVEATLESGIGTPFGAAFPGLTFSDLGEWEPLDPDAIAGLPPVRVRIGETEVE